MVVYAVAAVVVINPNKKTNMEDLLYEKRPVESSTPLHPGGGYLPQPLGLSSTNNNLTNIYHVVRPGHFRRDQSETSLGR